MSVAWLPADRPVFVFAGQVARHKRRFRDAELVTASLNRQRILSSFCQTEPLIVVYIYFSSLIWLGGEDRVTLSVCSDEQEGRSPSSSVR